MSNSTQRIFQVILHVIHDVILKLPTIVVKNMIFSYLMLYRTLPSWKIRSSLLSVVTS